MARARRKVKRIRARAERRTLRPYARMAGLLALEDALDAGSTTEERIDERERAEDLRAAFESRQAMPLGAGATLADETAEALRLGREKS